MGLTKEEGYLALSIEEEVTSTPIKLTRDMSNLVPLIQPSQFVCATYKITSWRAGQEVSFPREEMDKLGAFLKTDNLIPRHEEWSDGAIDQAELAVLELSAFSVPEESRRKKKGTEVKKGERKKKCVWNTAQAKRKVGSEVRKNEEAREDSDGRMMTRSRALPDVMIVTLPVAASCSPTSLPVSSSHLSTTLPGSSLSAQTTLSAWLSHVPIGLPGFHHQPKQLSRTGRRSSQLLSHRRRRTSQPLSQAGHRMSQLVSQALQHRSQKLRKVESEDRK
ncbi:hypothetical protein BLNAU_12223 [Blattamonas nauphoetae]|uniref:Uncharacterized protein n=1 Tax=Blattamonas nauphoetae TaxID=2049346 RepID=A0ABQ9XNG4_9EUKA|nr:hypothetical protein BLNAU_12223 [Blattamonas nauphoetae]